MEQQEEQEQRRWKRGDVGPDGRIFRTYSKRDGETWYSSIDKYNKHKEAEKIRAKAHTLVLSEEERVRNRLRRKKNVKKQIEEDPLRYKRRRILMGAKTRSKLKGMETDIDMEDIQIPEICPVLGIPIKLTFNTNTGSKDAPSIDRIDNLKGYTKDNIRIISLRANQLKNDATIEELRAVISYMETNLPKEQSPE